MLPLIKKTVSSVCPKTDKFSTRKQKGRWLIWLLGLAGSLGAFRKAKRYRTQARYVLCAVFIAGSVGCV